MYLNLFDNGEAPFRNFLGVGIAKNTEEAKEIAVSDLFKQAYLTIC